MSDSTSGGVAGGRPRPAGQKLLDGLERIGNRLPDPAMIFLIALLLAAVASAWLARVTFSEVDPRTVVRDAEGQVTASAPIRVKNMFAAAEMTRFMASMVKTFTDFPPLGVVLVALLGVAVAEHAGFIHAGIKLMLRVTPRWLLTPILVWVAVISHSAADSGYVLVIPLGGVVFAAAGRHPLAGIAAAFAGVSGAFSATFLPSSLDPMLQGFTQAAAQIVMPGRLVNPLCNWYFMAASSIMIVAVAWWLTDWVVEPRLRRLTVDGEPPPDGGLGDVAPRERLGFWWGLGSFGLLSAGLALACLPEGSPLRAKDGSLTAHDAPLMQSIVPLIALFFLTPGIVHGYVSGTFRSHRDVIQGMAKAMNTMGYYIVMAFCAAQFTYVFRESNLGALIAIKGGAFLAALGWPAQVTIFGIMILTLLVNLLIGSASAKWALLGPIFVPMLIQLGISPELTQAAYRIGDSSTNIITPLMPYFPLVVVYCQRYVRSTGLGTLIAAMLPYSVMFFASWTVLLMVWWGLGLPLGVQASYTP